jgi:hypothetical protein
MGIILAAVSVFMLGDAIAFGHGIRGGIGADFFPKVVSTGMLITALVLIRNGHREAAKNDKKETAPEGTSYAGFGAAAVLLVAYILVIKPLGFILSTIPFCFILTIILTPEWDKRHYIRFAIVSAVVTVAAYLLFVKVFLIMLPVGLLG